MDKRIEYAMNTLINTEIWSTNLYLSLQVYFEGQQLPILASWLSAQAQDNMGKVSLRLPLDASYRLCVIQWDKFVLPQADTAGCLEHPA